jgi:hypothetical protein
MYEQASVNNPNEKVESFVKGVIEFYNDLSAEQQVLAFKLIKEQILNHRNGMIKDCKSDLDAMESRLKNLVCGMDEINTFNPDNLKKMPDAYGGN